MVAATAYALVTERKVAGLHDHALHQDLDIAAERRGGELQGHDAQRDVRFGGAFPEIYDAGDKVFVSFAADGAIVKGYDRGTATFYEARVSDKRVQLYDHGAGEWFTFDVQDTDAAGNELPVSTAV